MNMQIIENEIEELENAQITSNNVLELASLYIIREHNKNANMNELDAFTDELNDILPAYSSYVSIKQKYQRHELTEDAVVYSMKSVCKELKELIQTIYSGTDMVKERKQLCSMLTDLYMEICG